MTRRLLTMLEITNHLCLVLLFVKIVESTMYDYNGQPMKDVFSGLNKYLAKKTSSREPKINYKIVQELFNSEEEGNSKFILAQRLFLSMKDINEENICSPDSFNALYHVDMALSSRTRDKLNKRFKCGRIQGIYFNLVEQHVKTCYPRYPVELAKELSIMDDEKMNYIKIFFDEVINKYINQSYVKKISLFDFKKQVEKSAVEKFFDIIDGRALIREMNDYNYIIRKLQQLEKIYPDEQFGKSENSSEDNCMMLYDHYLKEPCKYYREELGEKVFEPAEFDHKFLSNYDLKNSDFYRFWVYYKLCSVVDVGGEQLCKDSPFDSNLRI